jgi:hypothetical protein
MPIEIESPVEGVLLSGAYDDTGVSIKNRLHKVKPILFYVYLTVQISSI